jgi:hypothetical protein
MGFTELARASELTSSVCGCRFFFCPVADVEE